MAKKPETRYQTAAELTQALDEAIIATGVASSSESNSWQTVTLDSAGVRPPTGGTIQQQTPASSGFPLASQSGPHSDPQIKPAKSRFPWGIATAITVVMLAIGGLVGWLISSIDRDPGNGRPEIGTTTSPDEIADNQEDITDIQEQESEEEWVQPIQTIQPGARCGP